jgi:hypothetical protein
MGSSPLVVVLCPGPLVADSSAVSDYIPVLGSPGNNAEPNTTTLTKITATAATMPIIIYPAEPLKDLRSPSFGMTEQHILV